MLTRNTLFKVLFIIAVVVSVIYSANYASEKVSDSITIGTAILGFIAIIYQLNMDHKIKRAEFLFNLNQKFNDDNRIMKSYELLKTHRDNGYKFSQKEISEMGNYIMFFIVMNYLVNKGQVSMRMVDKIFANKFFLLCHNKAVQEQQFSSKEIEINYPIMELYETWYNYRKLHGLKTLYKDQKVYASNHDIYKSKKELITFRAKKKKKIIYYHNLLWRKVNTDKSFK